MDRVMLFLAALGACAVFGGDYLVIDCHPPYGAVRCASSEVLPHGGLTNRIYARGDADYLSVKAPLGV